MPFTQYLNGVILIGTAVIRRPLYAGLDYVSAPIFGRPDAVAARKVVVVLAGSTAAKDRVRPFLEVLGRGIIGDSWHLLRICSNPLLVHFSSRLRINTDRSRRMFL